MNPVSESPKMFPPGIIAINVMKDISNSAFIATRVLLFKPCEKNAGNLFDELLFMLSTRDYIYLSFDTFRA